MASWFNRRCGMRVEESKHAILAEATDFVYNRFDVLFKDSFSFLQCIAKDGTIHVIPLHVEGHEASLGLWLSPVPEDAATAAVEYVFRTCRRISVVRYQHYSVPLLVKGRGGSVEKQNHWCIMLPATEADLDSRLSAKKRYNINREKRIAAEQIAHYEIFEHPAETVPEQIVECYFQYKAMTHGIDYHMTPREYLRCYHVTHVYVLRFTDTSEIGAILFSCEQGVNAYLENLTFNPAREKYSLGTILYDEYLRKLVRKGKRSLYLGHGHQIYKTHYGAQENATWNGCIYRTRLQCLLFHSTPAWCREILWRAKCFMKRTVHLLQVNPQST